MPNFPSLKMRSFGHSLKGKRQKVPHFLLLFFAKINQIYLHFLLGLERYKRSGALQMLRSATSAPEGLKYRSSGSGYSCAPLRGAKILNAPLQRSGRSVKCLMLRSGALHNTGLFNDEKV